MATRDEVEAAVREYRAAKARLAELRAATDAAVEVHREAVRADDDARASRRVTCAAVEGVLDGAGDPAAVIAYAPALRDRDAAKARWMAANDALTAAIQAADAAESAVNAARGRVFDVLAAYQPEPESPPTDVDIVLGRRGSGSYAENAAALTRLGLPPDPSQAPG